MVTLSLRQLNRATLARQLLLERSPMRPLDAIELLCGMQAQAPLPPYFGLWSRLSGFEPTDLAGLIERREVVRIAAMRSTVHLMSAGDALAFRSLLQPGFERGLRATPWGKRLVQHDVDVAALVAAGRALLDEAPRTGPDIVTVLQERWPELDAQTIQNTLRTHLALVQVPPRGLWGRSGVPTLTTIEAWLGAPLPPDASLDAMVLRYLAAFGPASVADAQAWSGMTRLSEVFGRLADRLTTFTSPVGTTLYDLPDAPREDPDRPAPVRLLAEFDNLTLSYADRTRVLSDDDRRRAFTANGLIPGMILIDGVVAGIWKRRAATLTLTPFRRLRKRDRDAVTSEAVAMLEFAAPGTAPDLIWSE
jgi:hypothetical protein